MANSQSGNGAAERNGHSGRKREFERGDSDRAARVAIQKTYKLYIDGKFPRTESGRYREVRGVSGTVYNVSMATRKDFRNAVVAARGALDKWSAATAYNRGQILYRIAEMLEGRRDQFISEAVDMGARRATADAEVAAAIDRLVYYAGWSDKYAQVFGSINPVASSHFNFSLPEAVGVVSIIAPEKAPLLSLVSIIAPIIVGGNCCVALAAEQSPLSAVTLGEVIHTADVPAGVVNIISGIRRELIGHFSSHMDVNAIAWADVSEEQRLEIERNCALNVKRPIRLSVDDWFSDDVQSGYLLMQAQEIKTTWHPIGL